MPGHFSKSNLIKFTRWAKTFIPWAVISLFFLKLKLVNLEKPERFAHQGYNKAKKSLSERSSSQLRDNEDQIAKKLDIYLQYVPVLDLIYGHRSLNLRIGDLSNSWGASIHNQLHPSQKDPQKVQRIPVRRWHQSKHRSPLDILQSEDPESIQKYPINYINSIGSKEMWKILTRIDANWWNSLLSVTWRAQSRKAWIEILVRSWEYTNSLRISWLISLGSIPKLSYWYISYHQKGHKELAMTYKNNVRMDTSKH